ncbi:MAG TPA: DUF3891 family protein [Pirellulales bacterium]|jgi:hypothetical protein|nr:DUF3891 family protein [Pirellulales bacterium]
MIRRSDCTTGEERWNLISQVEHARLAGRLAESWKALGSFERPDELIQAVWRHDDGWSAWEVAPKVDAETGRPLDFTETPLTDSLTIWRDSIRSGAAVGPLAGYMVSGHFSALLERFSGRWKSDATLTTLAHGFLSEQRDERHTWLAIMAGSENRADQEGADRAVAWLQMFDAMSLWFCCAGRDQPERFATPDGGQVTMRPVSGPYEIEVSPWPCRAAALELEAVGRSIRAQRYASPSDVVTAPAQGVTLRWFLRPGSC